ncbi:hypothetical protein HDU81_010834, partial [Chytriomyces hyalinus]
MLKMKSIIRTTISYHNRIGIKVINEKQVRRDSLGKLWTEPRDNASPHSKRKAAAEEEYGDKKATGKDRKKKGVQATDAHNIEDFCQANPDFAPGAVLLAFIDTHARLVNVSDSSMAEHALASGIQSVIQDTLHEVLAERTDPERLTKAVSSSLADLLDHRLRMFAEQLRQEKNPA